MHGHRGQNLRISDVFPNYLSPFLEPIDVGGCWDHPACNKSQSSRISSKEKDACVSRVTASAVLASLRRKEAERCVVHCCCRRFSSPQRSRYTEKFLAILLEDERSADVDSDLTSCHSTYVEFI